MPCAGCRGRHPAGRRQRPRRQRGAVPARPRRQRRGALLGPARGGVAPHARRQPGDVHAPARPRGPARRGGNDPRAAARIPPGRCATLERSRARPVESTGGEGRGRRTRAALGAASRVFGASSQRQTVGALARRSRRSGPVVMIRTMLVLLLLAAAVPAWSARLVHRPAQSERHLVLRGPGLPPGRALRPARPAGGFGDRGRLPADPVGQGARPALARRRRPRLLAALRPAAGHPVRDPAGRDVRREGSGRPRAVGRRAPSVSAAPLRHARHPWS